MVSTLDFESSDPSSNLGRTFILFPSLIYLFATKLTPWRNGSASDSRSEGCVFESRRGQNLFYIIIFPLSYIVTPWRNGSASDSRSEGCVFKSRRGQNYFLFTIIIYTFFVAAHCCELGDKNWPSQKCKIICASNED